MPPEPKSKTKPPKRAPLPPKARIQKRPLLHPAPPSPYTSAATPKTIYISTRTPFMSAVKRAEKLLHLAEKRLVQSATVTGKDDARRRRAKEDPIVAIARSAEMVKGKEGGGEEICFKASGKAIGKGLQVAGWFLERGGMYAVRLRTGSVGVVDGVDYEEVEVEEGVEKDGMGDGEEKREEEELPEARIRTISVLEVYVSMK